MLLLTFEIDRVRYGIDAREVLEVVVDGISRPLPGAPAGVPGLLLHRGTPIPIIDVAEIVTGTPAKPRLSTRIFVVGLEQGGHGVRFGLRVEAATDAVELQPEAFREIGIHLPGAPCLGAVARLSDGLIQLVHVRDLLSPAILDCLQSTAAAASET